MRADAPKHLRSETAAWWQSVAADFELEAHHLRLLTLACEAWDRGQEAREALGDQGIIVEDRFGQPRAHPAVAIQRDSTIAFARMLRELALDVEPPREAHRPPMMAGRRAG